MVSVVTHYKDLSVWQKAMDMVDRVYAFCASFPAHENYGLRSQMIRPAVSVPSNIAEGSARHTTKDFIRFISIARGSMAELETQRLIALRQHYASERDGAQLLDQMEEVARMLAGLQKSLHQKL